MILQQTLKSFNKLTHECVIKVKVFSKHFRLDECKSQLAYMLKCYLNSTQAHSHSAVWPRDFVWAI